MATQDIIAAQGNFVSAQLRLNSRMTILTEMYWCCIGFQTLKFKEILF